MRWDKPEELTQDQLEELADAIDIINTARRIARRYGLDGLSDIAVLERELDVTHEMDRRRREIIESVDWTAALN